MANQFLNNYSGQEDGPIAQVAPELYLLGGTAAAKGVYNAGKEGLASYIAEKEAAQQAIRNSTFEQAAAHRDMLNYQKLLDSIHKAHPSSREALQEEWSKGLNEAAGRYANHGSILKNLR